MFYKLLCAIGLHAFDEPYIIETQREVLCEPRPIRVTDHIIKKRCKLCPKEKLVMRVDSKFK